MNTFLSKAGVKLKSSYGWLVIVGAGLAAPLVQSVNAEDALCATVKIEIQQELTLERQAFDAHMRINNGLTHIALEQVKIEVNFADVDGNTVTATSDPNNTNALFFIRIDSLENIGDVNGGGSVSPSTSADIHWLIIPAPGAGGTTAQGLRYAVGAHLTYSLGGEEQAMDVLPDTILVKPMPMLVLDYFLPNEVYGDDAFTAPVEPPVPFNLGVRVKNAGYGAAQNVAIDSGQPKIVENKLGLLIGFQITGSEVNGNEATDSLLVNLGDIGSSRAVVARWVMECTLSGLFESFTAEFSHADELGGQLTSLIESIHTHFLAHDVRVDLAGRDAIRDFLAKDGDTYTVYESDAIDTTVANQSDGSDLVSLIPSGDRRFYRLAVPLSAGPLFVKKPFTFGNTDTLEILSAVRSDGKNLDLANVWFSKSYNKVTHLWENYYLNLFDVNGGGNYTITVRDTSGTAQPPVLAYIRDQVGFVGDPLGVGFLVQASDPNGTIPTLTSTPLPTGATFTSRTNNGLAEGTFFWRPQEGQEGIYPVKFSASDGPFSDEQWVQIYIGRYGETTNADGKPKSLDGVDVWITNVWASSTCGLSRVQWIGAPGLFYDIYGCDENFGVPMNWVRLETNWLANSPQEEWTDMELGSNRMSRFYQVVRGGGTPMTNGIWGVIRVHARPGYTMISPPLQTDRRFDGNLGTSLGEMLRGDSGGVGDSVGDELYILATDGSWRVLYLDGYQVWRESNGSVGTNKLPVGQGFYVARHENENAVITFTGKVGNDGTATNRVWSGWNLITLSEGKPVNVQEAFVHCANGAPVGGASEEEADLLVIVNPDGSCIRLMYVQGWGEPYDGKWFDLSTFEISALELQPGQAYYYFRQSAAGAMDVNF